MQQRHAPEDHVVQQVGLEHLEKVVVVHLVAVLAVVPHPHAHQQLLGIVVRVHNLNVLVVQRLHRQVHLLHQQVPGVHRRAVELDAHHPVVRVGLGLARGVLVGVVQLGVKLRLQRVEVLEHRRVLGQHRPEAVEARVVVDARALGDVAQRCDFEHPLDALRLLVRRKGRLQVHRQRRHLRVLGQRQNLLEPWHALCHLRLGRRARKVERVERHLRGRLAHALGRNHAHHLARVHLGVREPVLNLRQDVVEARADRQLPPDVRAQQHPVQQAPEDVRRRVEGRRRVVWVLGEGEPRHEGVERVERRTKRSGR